MKTKELTKEELKVINGGNELSEGLARLAGYIASAIDNSLKNCNLAVTTRI